MSEQFIVITCVGKDRPGLVVLLTRHIVNANGNLIDSRMTVLGDDFAIITLVSGTWDTIAKLESSLKNLAEREDLSITTRRTGRRKNEQSSMPYSVDAICVDIPGIANRLAEFFANQRINIEDLTTSRYAAPYTGTPMFSAHIAIAIPDSVHINALREEFFTFCDDNNLDAMLEPLKI